MRIRLKTLISMILLLSTLLLTGCDLNPLNQPSDYSKDAIAKLKKEGILTHKDFQDYHGELNYLRAIDDVTKFYEALTYTPLTEKDVMGYDAALELPLRKALYIGLISPDSLKEFESEAIISREALCRLYSEAIILTGIDAYDELTERVIRTLEKASNYNEIEDHANIEDSLFVFGSYYERYKRYYINLLTGEDLDEITAHVIRVRITYKSGATKIINATCFKEDQFISAYHDYKDAVNIELLFNDGSIGSKNLCVLDTNTDADVIVFEYKDAPVKPAKSMLKDNLKDGISVSMVYNKPDGTVKKGFGYAYYELRNSLKLYLTGVTGLNSSGGGLFNGDGELVGMITSELTDEGIIHKAVSMAVVDVLHYDRESLEYFIKDRDTKPRKPNLIAITQDGIHYDLRWNNLDSDYYKIYMSNNDSSFFLLTSQNGEYRFYKGNNQTFTTVPNGRSVQFKAVAVKGDLISEPYISETKFNYNPSLAWTYAEDVSKLPQLKINNKLVDVSSIRVFEDGEDKTHPYRVNYIINDLDQYYEVTEFNPLIPYTSINYNDDYWFDVLDTNYRICVTYYGIYKAYDEVERCLENVSDLSAGLYYNDALETYEVFIDLIYGVSDQIGVEKIN